MFREAALRHFYIFFSVSNYSYGKKEKSQIKVQHFYVQKYITYITHLFLFVIFVRLLPYSAGWTHTHNPWLFKSLVKSKKKSKIWDNEISLYVHMARRKAQSSQFFFWKCKINVSEKKMYAFGSDNVLFVYTIYICI